MSKPVEQIVSEIRAVAENGYKEIVLTGIHLSSYGIDIGGVTLADAIEAAAKADGIERIRLGSLEPTVITPDFVGRISRVSKLCPSFHLSLQSGCDKTLKAMNRKYSSEQYAHAVALLRETFDNCAVTTDVIVGFPGETESDFEESCAFIENIGFAKMHIFPYSKRSKTKAALMDNQIPKSVKQSREKALAQIELESRRAYMEQFLNRDVCVLVEECEDGMCCGFSDNYIHVKFSGHENMCNTFVSVRVTEIDDDFLVGALN